MVGESSRADWWGRGRRLAAESLGVTIHNRSTIAQGERAARPSCLSSEQPSSTLDALRTFATSVTTPSARCTPQTRRSGMRLCILTSSHSLLTHAAPAHTDDNGALDKPSATSSATPRCRSEYVPRRSFSSRKCTATPGSRRSRTDASWAGRAVVSSATSGLAEYACFHVASICIGALN